MVSASAWVAAEGVHGVPQCAPLGPLLITFKLGRREEDEARIFCPGNSGRLSLKTRGVSLSLSLPPYLPVCTASLPISSPRLPLCSPSLSFFLHPFPPFHPARAEQRPNETDPSAMRAGFSNPAVCAACEPLRGRDARYHRPHGGGSLRALSCYSAICFHVAASSSVAISSPHQPCTVCYST